MIRTTTSAASALAVLALTTLALGACRDATSPSATASGISLASGSGGGGGGGAGTIPQIAGAWQGEYHYDFAFGAPADVTHAAWMTLNEDAAGNLTGSFCLSKVPSPGCFPMRGRVQSNGSVQLEFAADAPFRLTGALTGGMTCADGSTGRVMSGTFRVREALGTFAFNDCRG
jgi:hypothetical protein